VHYYPFNVSDYRKDASHLTPEEHYVYRWLIDEYYLGEKPICLDKRKIMRRMGLTLDQVDVLDQVLLDFFIETKKGYQHTRIERDLALWYAKSDKARASAMRRWHPGGKPPEEDANAMRTHSDGNASAMLPNTQDLIPNTQEDTTSENAARSSPVPIKEIVDKWNNFARDHSLPQVAKSTKTIQGQIRQRWLDIPSLSQWDNFFSEIAANDFLAGRAPAGVGRSKPFRSTLLWITKETNFNKIASGEYN
jgi:uncharacterized protein YdaU (DUF1376 family)